MRIRTLAVGVAVASVSASVFAQGPRRDGNWEVTIERSIPGMPAEMQKPITITQCVTKEEAGDPTKAFPQSQGSGRGGNTDCKQSDFKVDGNKITFTMKCQGPPAMTMKGEMVFDVNTYHGTVLTDIDRGGQPMTLTMKYTGKRLGDCSK